MNRSSKKQVAIALALMAVASAAIAGPTSEWQYIGEFQPATSNAGLATGPFQNTAGRGTHCDASSWSSGISSTATNRSVLSLDAQTAAAADDSRRALASVASSAPVVGSPASLELTLLNFIDSIRAQQVSNPFVQLQTASANIDYTINDVPAPVPLPPASWLFAAGLAALSIGRLARRGKASSGGARTLATA